MSVVNLSEVLIAPAGGGRLAAARGAVAVLGVNSHQPSEAVAVEAARLRARHPISLPDAYCLATAKDVRGKLASFDGKVLRAARVEGISTLN